MSTVIPDGPARPVTPPAIEVVAAVAGGCDALVMRGVMPAGVRL